MADATIRQRTTPTHTFTISFSTSLVTDVEISYKQNGEVKILKHLEDVSMTENSITLNLTAEETASLTANVSVSGTGAVSANPSGAVGIQIWLADTQGKSLLSDIFYADVYPSQYKGAV